MIKSLLVIFLINSNFIDLFFLAKVRADSQEPTLEYVKDKSQMESVVLLEKLIDDAMEIDDYKKALSISKKLLSKITDIDESDQNISSYIKILGKYSKYTEEQNKFIFNLLSRISILKSLLGEYDFAIKLFQEVINNAEKSYDKYKLELPFYYSELGNIHYELGNYSAAEILYEKSVEINLSELGYHEDTADDINNLGKIYSAIGQYWLAIDYFERALYMLKDLDTKDKSSLIRTKLNLASANLNFHDSQNLNKNSIYLRKAKKYQFKAYKLAKRYLKNSNPLLHIAINDLGAYFHSRNDLKKAVNLYEEAVVYIKRYKGIRHPILASTLSNLSMAYLDKNDYKSALDNATQALKIYKDYYGLYHPDTSLTLNNIAGIYRDSNNNEMANLFAKQAMEIDILIIQKEAPYLPKEERFDFINKTLGGGKDMAFSQALKSSSGLDLALFVRLNHQGLLEDIEKKQALLIKLSEQDNLLVKELNEISNKLSSTLISEDDQLNLLEEKFLLEKKIYRRLPKLNQTIIDSEIISKKLPSKSILIEYQKYSPFNPNSKSGNFWDEPRYVALIINSNGDLNSIDLGIASKIDSKIKQALIASEEVLADAQDLWNEVGDLIIKPLVNLINGIDTIFISPDNEINRVPFSAIGFNNGELLSEKIKLRLLTTGRELLNILDESESLTEKALVVANPSFNIDKSLVLNQKNKSNPAFSSQFRSRDLKSLVWKELPGTSKEGKQIAQITNAKYLNREKATVLGIQKYKSPKILHIASHAFYLSYKDTIEHPLLRSGIVLAGANQPNLNPNDDGYLTALEVTNIDLEGTELAVISGCESGKGDIQSGEGIYGLKRSIAVAGAKSSLLSLWKVNDIATAAFMENFYKRLKKGEGRAKALYETQKEFRNHSEISWRHPNVWAAFQLSGDWRPISF